MTPEQTRTLAHVQAEYERQVILKSRGLVKTTREWHRYEDAKADYFGYRHWLHVHSLSKRAA